MQKQYGLIGCGMMGEEHIRFVNILDGAKVSHVYDPVPQRAEIAASLAGGAKIYESLKELVTAPDVDALIIASPNFLHVDQLTQISALRTLPILCEKPLYVNQAQEPAIRKLQKDYAAPIWVAMEYRYMPPMVEFKSKLLSVTGGVDMLSLREHRYPFLEKVGDWNRFNENTGGTLVEKCCHFFDLMRFLLEAEPIRVMATAGQINNHLDETYDDRPSDIWDGGYVILDFDSGARACLELCMFAGGSMWNEELSAVGKLGKLECKIPAPSRFWPKDATTAPHPLIIESPRQPINPIMREVHIDAALLKEGDHHGSTFYQHQKFLALISGQSDKPDITLEDGLRAVKIGLAAQQSARTGQAVAL